LKERPYIASLIRLVPEVSVLVYRTRCPCRHPCF